MTGTVEALRAADAGDIAVIVGGTIPQADVLKLLAAGAAAVFPTGDLLAERALAAIFPGIFRRDRTFGASVAPQIVSLAQTLMRNHPHLDRLAEKVAAGEHDPYAAAEQLLSVPVNP